jgi:ABC-type lipoprotein release transport system permease subunit
VGFTHFASLVQTESFLIFNDESRGVLVKGVDNDYGKEVGLSITLSPQSVAIGSEIAKINKIAIGDEIVLAFGKGSTQYKNMPALSRFKVEEIVHHGVFQKDSRLIYARLDEIQSILDLRNRVNMISLNLPARTVTEGQSIKDIEDKAQELRMRMDSNFYFKPYWREFSALIEAVQAEKVLISLILQLIVVISIFNVLAFIIFLNEKKSKELFLFKALGLSRKAMSEMWMKLVVMIWLASCALSMVMVQFFSYLLTHVSLFELPAEVYFMPRIQLYLSWKHYAFVFVLALVWILLITYYLLRKLKRKSLLEGLRQEFA